MAIQLSLAPYIGRGGSQVPRSKITISGIKESKQSRFFVESTGIAADLVVLLFYGLAAERE